MTLDDLIPCSIAINTELLDMLTIFILKAPVDISYSNNEVGSPFDDIVLKLLTIYNCYHSFRVLPWLADSFRGTFTYSK